MEFHRKCRDRAEEVMQWEEGRETKGEEGEKGKK